MESLFDLVSSAGLLDILELEQVMEPVAEVVEPEVIEPVVVVEKKRIRFGSREYFDWLRPVKPTLVKATAFIKELVASEKKSDCPCCGGTGEYVGARYRTRCARCKGKGYLTQADENAYRTWAHARAQGLPKVRTDMGAAFNLA